MGCFRPQPSQRSKKREGSCWGKLIKGGSSDERSRPAAGTLRIRRLRIAITNYQITNYTISYYSICTSPPAPEFAGSVAGCCGARHESKIETWCTQDTVQCGAQDFSVTYSRRISATLYFSKGTAGYPRGCEPECTSPS